MRALPHALLPIPSQRGSTGVQGYNPTRTVTPRLPVYEESNLSDDDEVEVVDDPNTPPEIIDISDDEELADEEEDDIPKERKPQINDKSHGDVPYNREVGGDVDYEAEVDDAAEYLLADAAEEAGFKDLAEDLREDASLKKRSPTDIVFRVGKGSTNPFKEARYNWQTTGALGKRKFNQAKSIISREWKRATQQGEHEERLKDRGEKRSHDIELIGSNKKPRIEEPPRRRRRR